MDPLPGTDIVVDRKSPSLEGDTNLVFWVVAGLAAAFVAYLLIDWLLGRRRERQLRERWKRAAARGASINSSE
jgi:hypothetical protein